MLIDEQYINLVSYRLSHFSNKRKGLYNFRCPYCGDSQKHKNKARGYIFKVKSDYVYKCHNCGVGRTLSNFLKDQDPILHDRYIMDKFRDSNSATGKGSYTPEPKFNFKKPVFDKTNTETTDLEKISNQILHTLRENILSREESKIWNTSITVQSLNNGQTLRKKVFDTLRQDSPRIIIPFKDKQGNLFGYQGRSLAPKAKLRYITIMLDEEQPKIFGLDRIKPDQPVHIVEGPFDSTFIKNSVAMGRVRR